LCSSTNKFGENAWIGIGSKKTAKREKQGQGKMGSIDRRRYRPRSMAAAINWRAKIQQRYGLAKDLVRKDVDHWLDAQP